MRNFKFGKTLLASALGVAVLAGVAPPAQAADTTATFTVTAGSLSIAVPATKAFGSTAAGTAATAQLGTVTVSDGRGAVGAAWTATVSATNFTTTVTGAPAVANSALTYWSGVATTTGTATFVPGQLLDANKVTLAAARTAYSASATVGSNTAAWNPTVAINAPTGAVAGDYTGTITHSVA